MEQKDELRARIAQLGFSHGGFARHLKELGDDRDKKNIRRWLQRMLAGDARVSGEMRALLGLMEKVGNRNSQP
jgi:hypothetical protein